MKTEVSAGGLIVRKQKGVWLVLLIKDMNNSWTFPKGKVEKGESRKDTAIREIREEVGLTRLHYTSPVSKIKYMYRRNGLIAKTVYYYLFEAFGREKIVCQKSEGIRDARFVTFDKAISIIGYTKTNKPMLVKTQKQITV